MNIDLQGGELIQKNADGTVVYRFVEDGRTRDVTVDADGDLVDEKRWLKEPPGADPRADPRAVGPMGNIERRPI